MKKLFFIFGLSIFTLFGHSQNQEGFWDTQHASTETLKIKANQSSIFKSLDLPIGTTEVLYRIKVVETNSKITESLVSVLKSIPDPTGIAQGTAGVIFLATTITGKDKFDYALFTNSADASNFKKLKKSDKSCFQSLESSSSDSKIITFNNGCFNPKTSNFYFVISSSNWILEQSVLVEVIPFVNKKLARGWNEESKQELVNLAKQQSFYKLVKNQNGFILQFKNYIEDKLNYTEFQKLLAVEKIGIKEEASSFALKKIGESNLSLDLARNAAEKAILNNDFAKAIILYENTIINANGINLIDYSKLSLCYLITRQFEKAKNTIYKGLAVEPNNLNLQLDLANYYLLNDNWKKCKEIHLRFSNQNLNANLSWKQESNRLLNLFEKNGFKNKNFKKLEKFLDN